ncbi:MAG: ArsR/SmtB family transcription factor [Candidatus Woesearchaeota archaeon]
MEAQMVVSDTKWDIIARLAKNESSPTELSAQLKTSVAHISMQLRLLEASGIVQKRRVSNSKAGKPRLLYQLTKDVFFVSAASKLIQYRSYFDFDIDKQVIARIWQLPKLVQGPLIAFYYRYAGLFTQENEIYLVEYGDAVCRIIISNEKKPLPPKLIHLPYKDQTYAIDTRFVARDDLKQFKRLTRIH